jgi:chaperonin cofactor prefoldin
MMGSGNAVLLLLGEAWFETPEEEATEFAEQMVETIQTQVQGLHQEKEAIQAEQAVLKQQLYGRFGTSIQLEA